MSYYCASIDETFEEAVDSHIDEDGCETLEEAISLAKSDDWEIVFDKNGTVVWRNCGD